MRSIHCALATVLLSVSAASAPAAPPNIYNLGTLGGSSSAVAINNAGQVMGTSEVAGASWHAFVYTGTPGSGGMMHDLGTLGGTYSHGWDINDSGQIVGESHAVAPHSRISAVLYTGTPGSSGMMRELGTLGGISSSGINSWAYGVNDSGQIVGKSTTLPNFHEHAFLYSGTPGVDGVMHDLGINGAGVDINNSGQIVGVTSDIAVGFNRAFLYSGTPGVDGVMRDLGSIDPYDVGSEAAAINDRGQVTGTYYVWGDEHYNVPRAFLYTGTPGVDGVMHDLGIEGYGSGINERGQVVGSECAFNSFPCEIGHAFVYTGVPGVDGQKIDLDAWLDINNPVEGAKWTLSYGSGINDNGLITGQGRFNDGPGGLSDGYRAFLLDARSLLLPDLPGDFNFDGSVDAADYVVWRKNPSAFGGDPAGYNTWRSNFGRTFGSGLAAGENPVPEPSGLALLTLAVPALLRRR